MLLGTCFREWKGWTFEQNAGRKFLGLQQHHEFTEREFLEKMESLQKKHGEELEELEGKESLQKKHGEELEELEGEEKLQKRPTWRGGGW
jgi:hypothetical protein